MLDYVIRSATLIDGTGDAPRTADVGIHEGRIVAVGQVRRGGHRRARRDRAVRHTRRRRPAHALRRPALLGPLGVAVERARRDDGDRRELWLHAGADQRRGRRLHPSHDGQGRGHAARRPRERRPLELVDVRRVPRCARRQPRRERRVLRRPLRPAAQGARVRRGARRSRPTTRSPPCASSWRTRWPPAASASRRRSRARTRTATGKPISSRHADRREMLAFCAEVAAHEGTTLEYITNGCLDSFSPEEVDLMTAMSVTAQRPLNWNVLTVDARSGERIEHQLAASSAAVRRGRAHRRAYHADARPHEHELPHPLRPLPHPGLGRRHGAARGRAQGQAGRPRRPRHARRARPQQGGRRLPRPVALGHVRHR